MQTRNQHTARGAKLQITPPFGHAYKTEKPPSKACTKRYKPGDQRTYSTQPATARLPNPLRRNRRTWAQRSEKRPNAIAM